MRRAVFFVKELRVHPVGISLHRQRPIAQMGQEHRRDANVIVDHLTFGESDFGIKHLVEVRDGELFAFNDELCFFGHCSKRRTLNAERPIANSARVIRRLRRFSQIKSQLTILCSENLRESAKSADYAKNLSGGRTGWGLQMRPTQCWQLSWPVRISISTRKK